jgi:hypothetical protein
MHDGRVTPWIGQDSSVLIRNIAIQSSIFPSTLRNGILSSKLVKILINLLFYFFKINIIII